MFCDLHYPNKATGAKHMIVTGLDPRLLLKTGHILSKGKDRSHSELPFVERDSSEARRSCRAGGHAEITTRGCSREALVE